MHLGSPLVFGSLTHILKPSVKIAPDRHRHHHHYLAASEHHSLQPLKKPLIVAKIVNWVQQAHKLTH